MIAKFEKSIIFNDTRFDAFADDENFSSNEDQLMILIVKMLQIINVYLM